MVKFVKTVKVYCNNFKPFFFGGLILPATHYRKLQSTT